MAVEIKFKSVADFGCAVNRYGILRIDNVLASLNSRIDEYFLKADEYEECKDPQDLLSDDRQGWILYSANLKLSPLFNHCKFGSLHDVTIQLENKQRFLRYYTCKIWHFNGLNEEVLCSAKIVKSFSTVDNFTLAKQDDEYHHSKLPNYTCSIKIRPSDLDVNQSIKFNNLLLYCQHAASRAINDNKLENVSDLTRVLEIEQVQIDLISCVSKGNVKIHIWQNREVGNHTLRFLITQAASSVCQVSIKLNSRNRATTVPYGHLPVIYYEDNCRIISTSHCCSYRDRFNNPHLIHFLRMTADISSAMLFCEDIASLKQLSIGAKNVTVRHHLHLPKKFFSLKHDAVLQQEIKIASIGSSSYIINQNAYYQSNCVIRIFGKIVRSVDGKVKELPAWYKKKYEHLISKINYPKVGFPTEIPNKAYKYQFESRFDDIDDNFHTSQTVYICNSLNAASDVVRKKLLAYHTDFGNDFNPSYLSDVHTNYYAESFEFQVLDVYTWQDCKDNTLQFLIKQHEQTLFYMIATIRDEMIVESKL